jgi:hypothetical protein
MDPQQNYPLQMPGSTKNSRSKKQSVVQSSQDPAQNNKLRYMYNDGQSQKLPKVSKPYYVKQAQSKIRKNVSYFRNLHKDKANKSLFNKEPQVYYNEHPSSYNYDAHLDSNIHNDSQGVALRRRSEHKPERVRSNDENHALRQRKHALEQVPRHQMGSNK